MEEPSIFLEPNLEKPVERPFVCGECRRPLAFLFTEVAKGHTMHIRMCKECPELEKRLKGGHLKEGSETGLNTSMCCGSCGTTLDSVIRAGCVGCKECYEVFGDKIVEDLLNEGLLPTKEGGYKKGQTLHIGQGLGNEPEMPLELRLYTLNESLNATLKREDYEEAARIRDEIKALKSQQSEESEEPEKK